MARSSAQHQLFELSKGLGMKSYAPARMAAMAASIEPNAVTQGSPRIVDRMSSKRPAQLDSAHAPHVDVGDDGVEGLPIEGLERELG